MNYFDYIEFILVSDGSNDNFFDYISEFADN